VIKQPVASPLGAKVFETMCLKSESAEIIINNGTTIGGILIMLIAVNSN